MKVLVACEESQTVCKAFRQKGHEAYSCDILDCSGGAPQYHIKGDVLPLINGFCEFVTLDGENHVLYKKWDMIIAHPPCTYLTVTANRWFNIEKYGDKAVERFVSRVYARDFFMKIANADCRKICIENPVGVMSSYYRKPDQIIQPYMFGDCFEKKTCLWLKELPCLIPDLVVTPEKRTNHKKSMPTWYAESWKLPSSERSRFRSKTFPGIARAMAEQWG